MLSFSLVFASLSLALAAKAILMHGSEVEPEVALAVPSILAGAARLRLASNASDAKANTTSSKASRPLLALVGTASAAFQNEGYTPPSDMKRFVDDELGWAMGSSAKPGKSACW